MSDRWVVPGGDPGPASPPDPRFVPGAPLVPTTQAGWGDRPGWGTHNPKPGVIALRPLTLGDISRAVMTTIRVNPRASIGLAALVSLAVLLPVTAASTAVAALTGSGGGPDELDITGTLTTTLPTLGSLLTAGLLAAFMAWVVSQATLGRTVTLGETWAAVRGRAWAATAVVLLLTLIQVVVFGLLAGPGVLLAVAAARTSDNAGLATGVVLAILGGLLALAALLFVATRWCFATSVLAVERIGIGAALRRSWRLTAGRPFWRVLGIRLLAALAVGVVSQVVTLPLTVLLGVGGALTAADDPSRLVVAQTVATGLTALLVGALTTPITAGVDALLYLDQRIRREGLDVAIMHGLQTGQVGFPPPPAAG